MEKIFFGGTIRTMDTSNPVVEAVLVEDDKIVAVGSYEDMVAQAGSDVELVDLEGNAMLPGLFEPHAHFDLASFMHKGNFIGGLVYDNADEVVAKMKEAAEKTPKGKWLFLFGLDYLINRDLPELDRHWLDENVSTEHPIMVCVQSMHTSIVNTLALETMGIDRNTPDARDGRIYHDEDGEPNGILTEQTLTYPFLLAWINDWKLNPAELMKEQFIEWKKKGITSTWTAGMQSMFPNQLALMNQWEQAAPLRQDYAIAFAPLESGAASLDDCPEDNPMFKFTGIKFWYDGSPYTGNMFMYDNYLENEIMQDRLKIPAHQAGERLFDQEYFYNMFKKYHDMGFQISVHSQGDRSSHELLDIMERVITESPRTDHRHRIEHCAFMTQEDIQRCADLGITLSYHVGHLFYYGEALNELVIGEDRMNSMFMRCRDALDKGIKISLHSDDPMYFADPLMLVATACSRTSRKGNRMTTDQAITVDEAMRAVTIDAAWQQKRENEVGSIEVGKYADFTILSEDPYEVEDPYNIKDIDVVTTYLAGIDTDTMY